MEELCPHQIARKCIPISFTKNLVMTSGIHEELGYELDNLVEEGGYS